MAEVQVQEEEKYPASALEQVASGGEVTQQRSIGKENGLDRIETEDKLLLNYIKRQHCFDLIPFLGDYFDENKRMVNASRVSFCRKTLSKNPPKTWVTPQCVNETGYGRKAAQKTKDAKLGSQVVELINEIQEFRDQNNGDFKPNSTRSIVLAATEEYLCKLVSKDVFSDKDVFLLDQLSVLYTAMEKYFSERKEATLLNKTLWKNHYSKWTLKMQSIAASIAQCKEIVENKTDQKSLYNRLDSLRNACRRITELGTLFDAHSLYGKEKFPDNLNYNHFSQPTTTKPTTTQKSIKKYKETHLGQLNSNVLRARKVLLDKQATKKVSKKSKSIKSGSVKQTEGCIDESELEQQADNYLNTWEKNREIELHAEFSSSSQKKVKQNEPINHSNYRPFFGNEVQFYDEKLNVTGTLSASTEMPGCIGNITATPDSLKVDNKTIKKYHLRKKDIKKRKQLKKELQRKRKITSGLATPIVNYFMDEAKQANKNKFLQNPSEEYLKFVSIKRQSFCHSLVKVLEDVRFLKSSIIRMLKENGEHGLKDLAPRLKKRLIFLRKRLKQISKAVDYQFKIANAASSKGSSTTNFPNYRSNVRQSAQIKKKLDDNIKTANNEITDIIETLDNVLEKDVDLAKETQQKEIHQQMDAKEEEMKKELPVVVKTPVQRNQSGKPKKSFLKLEKLSRTIATKRAKRKARSELEKREKLNKEKEELSKKIEEELKKLNEEKNSLLLQSRENISGGAVRPSITLSSNDGDSYEGTSHEGTNLLIPPSSTDGAPPIVSVSPLQQPAKRANAPYEDELDELENNENDEAKYENKASETVSIPQTPNNEKNQQQSKSYVKYKKFGLGVAFIITVLVCVYFIVQLLSALLLSAAILLGSCMAVLGCVVVFIGLGVAYKKVCASNSEQPSQINDDTLNIFQQINESVNTKYFTNNPENNDNEVIINLTGREDNKSNDIQTDSLHSSITNQ